MVPLAGNEIFNSFFSDLAVLPILPETVGSKSLSNLDFIIESILANYKKNFVYRESSYNCFTEIAFSTTVSTAGKPRDSGVIASTFRWIFCSFYGTRTYFFAKLCSTTKYRNATFTTYSEILVPNGPVLKIIMSILLSISGSTGFLVVIFESVVPRERISSGGFYAIISKF